MIRGKVRWFNDAKGYGLIECDEVDDAIYVHFSALQDGHETLRPGDEVDFDIAEASNGDDAPRAVDVHCDAETNRRLFRS